MKDKGLFFLTLSFIAFWLILDQIFGNKLIEQFVTNILPSTKKSDTSNTSSTTTGTSGATGEKVNEVVDDAVEKLKSGLRNDDGSEASLT